MVDGVRFRNRSTRLHGIIAMASRKFQRDHRVDHNGMINAMYHSSTSTASLSESTSTTKDRTKPCTDVAGQPRVTLATFFGGRSVMVAVRT
ncbi:MAG: hypothetical protein KGQ60_10320 [Planctomycetes bacterium]|nr:hypothetical protein [Planctomycetota bacterium]